ncbi:tRNase Z TRZ3, mitochondrial isoform X1 [Capsicum annuum]|uniref:tRNase Z TRZ3, mitochondrial isoform X1 n=1 Tax=Capsicum annuum TaxID=4072 RepID=UPI001FB196B0|nr:tRNase Z TRZ3, mitochondrial isoform X1 [Capsicum annuum]
MVERPLVQNKRKMPQMSSLRLLLFSSPLLTPKPPLLSLCLRRPLLFAAYSSYSRKPKNIERPGSLSGGRRRSSSSSKTDKGKLAMEESSNSSSVNTAAAESSTVGFNKRRAEGKDKFDGPKKNLQLKVRKLNPVNTISYVQILGTGMDTQDTTPSVLLFFDKQRFIFNAGEGLQRFCTEHKIKLSKIDHIFLSRVCSETAGGLPGLLLTLAGTGEEGMSVNIWGPSDLKYLVNAMKSFIPNAAMVHARSFGPSVGSSEATDDLFVPIDDEVVKISAVLLRPRYSKVSKTTKEGSSELDDPLVGVNHLAENLSVQRMHSTAEFPLKPGDLAVVYICELPEIKGKFDPKKAAALGLRPGPKYRELQLGNSVQSDHQDIMVHPSDVLDPSVPGPIVLVVDCPTPSHLQELSSIHSLTPFYTYPSEQSKEMCKKVDCVIHLSPASITCTTEYQQWMSRFGEVQHVMAGHQLKNVEIPILKSSARIATRLNYLCPQFFPSPGFWSLPRLKSLPSVSKAPNEFSLPSSCEVITAENLLKFHLRPLAQLGLDRTGIPEIISRPKIIEDLISEIPEIVGASEHITQLLHGNNNTNGGSTTLQANNVVIKEPSLQETALPCCLEGITREDMEIVLLGTGSSQPSKYRNVTSIFINLFTKGSILLDCGEGTLGQLKRRFGIEGADEAVKGLRCIWISHIHADHHTGLARILALRRDLLKETPHEPLVVVGPRQLKTFLDAYQKLEDLDMQFLDCRHTTEASLKAFESSENKDVNGSACVQNDQKTGSDLFAKGRPMESYWKRPGSPVDASAAFPLLTTLKKILREAGLEALISFPVIHCPQAYGVVLKAADRTNSTGKKIPGWKIVYSGDTRPCPELVKASRGATVLIHEATFEDGMVQEAIARNHSTTQEAIEVGDSAGAYRIILTHFSQRYPKIPVFDEAHMHKTSIAFDMMSVNLADLPMLPRVLPYLKLLFRDEMIVDESDDVDVAAAAI